MGVAPQAGYASVTIAPQVSKTNGPSAVNASIATVRGTIKSSWVRASNDGVDPFELKVTVPVGSHAVVRVPLHLGEGSLATVRLVEVSEGIELFGGSVASNSSSATRGADKISWLLAAARLVGGSAEGDGEGLAAIEIETAAGEFHFQLFP